MTAPPDPDSDTAKVLRSYFDATRLRTMLRQTSQDVASLHRYLVEAGLFDRDGGEYWRSGGPVDSA